MFFGTRFFYFRRGATDDHRRHTWLSTCVYVAHRGGIEMFRWLPAFRLQDGCRKFETYPPVPDVVQRAPHLRHGRDGLLLVDANTCDRRGVVPVGVLV